MTETSLTATELFAALRSILLAADPITALNSALCYATDLPVSKLADADDMAALNKALNEARELLQRGYRHGVHA
jgi:hypothetical protein